MRDHFAPLEYMEIIEHPEFSTRADEYRSLYPQADDVYHDLCWKLARRPKLGIQIEDSEYRIYETDQIGKTPSFWVVYKYDPENHHVTLLRIKAAHINEEE